MRAGELRHRIVIQHPVETQDATTGEVVITWPIWDTVWADVRPLRGTEEYVAQQLKAGLDTRFKLRYRTDITPMMRISYGGRAYDLQPPTEIGHREGLQILATTRGE